jgi:deoxyribodipyrimidine photolyase-related protein
MAKCEVLFGALPQSSANEVLKTEQALKIPFNRLSMAIAVRTKSRYTHLRLILGDQLNAAHSWFTGKDNNTLYLIAELKQEATYVKHHIQKICAFFCAMEHFAQALENSGHHVLYLTLDDTQDYDNLSGMLISICKQFGIKKFSYQQPDEYRLAQQLATLIITNVDIEKVSTEHFLLAEAELEHYIQPGQHNRMETFYRKMRKRFKVLMEDEEPLGGQWNYDEENRHKLKQQDLDLIPTPLLFSQNIIHYKRRLQKHNIETMGKVGDTLIWPVTRQQAMALLYFFCQYCLPHFGRFQDAMTANSPHKWSLYHSRLSFALNTKMLAPRIVIAEAIKAFNNSAGAISLAQVEGFIRQILGWREYIRAVYWVNMPNYQSKNFLSAHKELPDFFWTGRTNMRCMQQAIEQSLDTAYAHHIQRLMVTGNFCLLAGIDTNAVDVWYLGIYIDAIEWVELPNTRGMSQFADGGWVATKPYTASGNYINKMSDYCTGCHYDVKQKVGDLACPFNSLYWHFLDKHKDLFSRNPRITMAYKIWAKYSDGERQTILAQAQNYLSRINEL